MLKAIQQPLQSLATRGPLRQFLGRRSLQALAGGQSRVGNGNFTKILVPARNGSEYIKIPCKAWDKLFYGSLFLGMFAFMIRWQTISTHDESIELETENRILKEQNTLHNK